jgi:glycosyltransferase A (GT-A) superfamily protein (DUF2064 family)
MGRMAVTIMAKAPRAGEVKTRLCPPFSTHEAAELYRCFLLDKIEQVRALKAARPAIAYTPAEGKGYFEELAPGFVLIPQRGPDLGARLTHSFDQLFARGYAGHWLSIATRPPCPHIFSSKPST